MEPPNASSVKGSNVEKSAGPICSQFSANLFRLLILAQPNKICARAAHRAALPCIEDHDVCATTIGGVPAEAERLM